MKSEDMTPMCREEAIEWAQKYLSPEDVEIFLTLEKEIKMRKIIDGTRYDTNSAILGAEYESPKSHSVISWRKAGL